MSFSVKNYLFVFLFLTLFVSCGSLKQPKTIEEPLDYSNESIVNNEITRINKMRESEPVRALWRSLLMNDSGVIENSLNYLQQLFETAIEEKNYFEAKKYYTSLITAGWKNDKYTQSMIDKLASQEVPGFGENRTPPKNIADCMDAAVTVWLDRGLKVQNGAGYADIIIGSGFFIDSRGYIVTNHHVIESMVNPKYEGYSRLYIKLPDDPDTKIPAKVIGYDSVLDLALLKTEIVPRVVLNLGSSKDLQIGTKISAIGTPVGLEGTLTSGIISSTDRKLVTLGNVFQIDAAVNSGNSGGPLIDDNMNVQAIVFAGMPRFQGLNFAIPVEYLKQELNLMYSCEEVIHPWIGCYGHTKRQGKKKIGLEIQYVLPGGSASLSGLETGDVITSLIVDSKKYNISSIEDFHFVMMAFEPETLIKCEYLDKNEEQKEKYIYLDRRPETPVKTVFDSDYYANSFVPLFGMRLKRSSTLSRNSYTIEDIIKGSTADEMSFSIYDAVTVKDVKIDLENEILYAQILAKRKKKGFLDISVVLGTQLDNPYFF